MSEMEQDMTSQMTIYVCDNERQSIDDAVAALVLAGFKEELITKEEVGIFSYDAATYLTDGECAEIHVDKVVVIGRKL